MSVYLVHFEEPYKHARHYLGWSDQLAYRIAHHKSGSGANLLRVVNEAGIRWVVARVWHGADRSFERRLKGHSSTRYCPVCNGHAHVCWDCGKVYRYPGWLARHQRLVHGVDETEMEAAA
jgi:predicted GIY-YIG superfamily endonuclease